MFRDDAQLARACRALLATVRLERLWTDRGPTTEAGDLLDANGANLSSGERVVFLAAWAFWNGGGGVTLAEIVRHLDPTRAEALCFLVLATKHGEDSVDEWLAEHANQWSAP